MIIFEQYRDWNIKTVIQCGDIHIKLLRRHDEYQQIFDKFYTDLKKYNNKETLLVLTGDILHSKTEISPELIRMTSEFFRQLSSILPTIIIAGNHDANLASNRLDSLSPIVNNLGLPRIHYLKKSDVYRFSNIDIAVYSVFDDNSQWPTITDCNNKKNIALYHGPVTGAKTGTGFELQSDVDISLWNGFDAVLLGDIHTRSCLQKFNKPNKLPEIVYNGSMIQQSHGEILEGHGYVVWDMEHTSHTFVELPNEYGYATLIYGKDNPDTVLKFPANLRLRILTSDSDSPEFKSYISEIKSKRNILELTITKNFEEKTISKTTRAILNINDIEYQNKLIKEYLNITDVILLSDIFELNKITNSKLAIDQIPKNTVWKPILMEFDNLFSYGEGNSIDFTNLTGVIGVFGENQIGKTSIFNALCFALFDKTPTAFRNHHILNTRKNSGYIRLLFSIGADMYEIERKLIRKKDDEVKIEVNFYKINGKRVSLNGLEKRLTDNIICQYVGSYDDFILTTLSAQNQNSSFIDKGQSERKDLLSLFLGLTIFDKLYDIANEEKKLITAEVKFLNIDDLHAKKLEYEKYLEELTNKNASLFVYSFAVEEELNNIKYQLERLHVSIIPTNTMVNYYDILLLQDEKETEERLQQSFTSTLNSNKLKLQETEEQIHNINTELQINSISHEKYLEFIELEKKYVAKTHSLEIIKKDIKEKEKKLEHLSQHKYDPNCNFCIDNIFVKDAIKTKNELKIVKDLSYEIIEEVEQLHDKVQSYGNIKQLYNSTIALKDRLKIIENSKGKIVVDIELLKRKLLEREIVIGEINTKIKLYNEYKQAMEHNKSVTEDVIKYRKLEDQHTEQFNVHKRKLLDIDREFTQTQTLLLSVENNINKYTEKEKKLKAYELYLGSISRDGIPYKLIEYILPILENKINEILTQITTFSIELETDGKNINANLLHRNSKWPLELASGLEKFVSGLAIRVGLLSISNLARSNHIIIDEGFGSLDSSHLGMIDKFIRQLLTTFDTVYVISHLDSIRDIADDRIDIIFDNEGFSKIMA